ncbi:MAG: hypothetical protein ABIJ00_03195 [Candidatus Eisenbacteria bacterium]
MLRALRLGWVLAVASMCFCVSDASSIEVRPRKVWSDIHPFEVKPYQIEEDFGGEPRYDCPLQYYYYIPCPTYSWFWGVYGWEPGDRIGACFRIGDFGTGGFDACDPTYCHGLTGIRVLDFAGYGTYYPGLFTIEMDVWCSDASLSPLKHIWNSRPLETGFGWNYFDIGEEWFGVNIGDCYESGLDALSIIVTMTCTGTNGVYPAFGFDNVGTAVELGCEMHDSGCLPAVYPRGWPGGEAPSAHSGYVGRHAFEHLPPLGIPDGKHASEGALCWYGFAEAAWRIYLYCESP